MQLGVADQSQTQSLPDGYKWRALSATSLGSLSATLNSGTLIIALPVIMKQLHTSLESILWVVMVYMLVSSAAVVNVGRLGDMFGRRKLYNLGFAIFTVTALLCGLASTAGLLIFYRVLQGIGGALMMANSTALVTDAFSGAERGRALGINAMVAAVGQAVGPVLGGWLTNLGVRWVFWYNVPLGIIGTWVAITQLREVGTLAKDVKFDWTGTALFLVAIVSMLTVLSFGGIYGWGSVTILSLIVIFVISLLAFIAVERKVSDPVIDINLFRIPAFAIGNATQFINSLVRMAVMFLLIFYLQGARGLDAVMAGLLVAPVAVGMLITAPVAGWMADRVGNKVLSPLGLFLSGIGCLGLLTVGAHSSYVGLCVWQFIIGLGSGIFSSPNTSAVMGAVPNSKRGVAAGTRMMLANLGMVIAIALTLIIVTNVMPTQIMMSIFAGLEVDPSTIALGGFIHGLQVSFATCAALSLLAGAVSVRLKSA
ncbi:MAG: drug resistance transporter, EmrB/QacA subfamily [Firmicutes bacterium]|nr:drug resistance transporter, EmrB/QacA subfamily [Bacillota bacterium]